jgi:flagellar biosynthesis GTPase FlhF
VFEVEIVEVKEKIPPAIDDEFAKKYDAENLEKLREGVRRDLGNELKYLQSKAVRGQIVRALLDHVNFDLPETPVAQVTRNVVYDIVNENTKRGVAREMIEKQKDEIYSAAANSAKERVKLAFLIQRIAEQEKILGVAGGSFEARAIAGAGLSDSARKIPQGFAEAQRRERALRPDHARKGVRFSGNQCQNRERQS